MTAGGGALKGGGTEHEGKRTHERGQQCGGCCRERGRRGLNGNGKKYSKD